MADLALIVDDSRTVCVHMCRTLGAAGHLILLAQDLESAISSFGEQDPKVVFLDLFLPGKSGIEAVADALATWKRATLVAMTAGEGAAPVEQILAQARQAGAHLTLPKPFTEKALTEAARDGVKIFNGEFHAGHILLVEDSSAVQSFIRRGLNALGFRVSAVAAFEIALQRLENESFDLLITDIFMAGMGGIAGIQAARNHHPDLPIIAMSGGLNAEMGGDKTLIAARLIGANAVISKPFKAEALAELARSVLAASSRAP